MRIVRSLHPTLGWHPAFGSLFKFMCVLTGATILAVIAGTVQSFYTLDPKTKAIDRGLQLYGSTFLATLATLPLPITILSLLIPYSPPDRFGVGRLRTKIIVLFVSTTLLAIGAWYRCGSTWAPPVPRSQPLPSYLAKGAFYIFNFFVEIQTVLMYAILRVDLRFHVPNGAHGVGSYSSSQQLADVEMQDSRPTSASNSTNEKEKKVRRPRRLSVSQSTQAYQPFGSRTTKRLQCPYLHPQPAALSLPSRHLIHRPYLRHRRINANPSFNRYSKDNQRRCRPCQQSRSTHRPSGRHRQQSKGRAGATANSSGS